MRILLAEDEKSLSNALVKIFKHNNYDVDAVYNGIDAYECINSGIYDVVVLDIMMPKMDGISVLKKIRNENNNIPVLILTAKSDVDDKVNGLDSGANDYLSKPFDAKELLARIRCLTRGQKEVDNKITVGNITLDTSSYSLNSSKGSFHLANKEYQLMDWFMKNPNKIISTEQLFIKVWGYDTESEINVVWVYVSYLRNKLQSLNANIQIKASRNAGYSLESIDD